MTNAAVFPIRSTGYGTDGFNPPQSAGQKDVILRVGVAADADVFLRQRQFAAVEAKNEW